MELFYAFGFKFCNILFSDDWVTLKDMPNPLFGLEVAKSKDKLFAISGYKYCYDFVTDTWTELNCPAVGLLYPVCYNNRLYVFPKYERWTLEQEIEEPLEKNIKVGIMNINIKDAEFHLVPIIKKFGANRTNIVAIGKKFFYIQVLPNSPPSDNGVYSYQLASGLLDQFQNVVEIAMIPVSIGNSNDTCVKLRYLVALPNYPLYKCTAKT